MALLADRAGLLGRTPSSSLWHHACHGQLDSLLASLRWLPVDDLHSGQARKRRRHRLARLATWTALHTLLHMYACYAAFRAFGLDQGGERKPLSRSACAVGLGASYAFMLTGLHFL